MRSGDRRGLGKLVRNLTVGIIVLTVLGLDADPRLSAQQPALTGWFHIIWGDPRPPERTRPAEKFLVIGDRGDVTEIQLSEVISRRVGGVLTLNRKYVTVEGQLLSLVPRRLAATAVRITLPPGAAREAPLTGSQRWVNILCRFADSPTITPHELSWFLPLMGVAIPGLDHYWQQQSFDNINIAGTDVVGWFNLPQPRSYYIVNNSLQHGRAVEDCTSVADSSVFFPDYVGINLMFNQTLDCCAWGGSWTLNRDGQTRNYRVTWLPPWGYENQGVLGHEMGHGFGLPHSSGPYGATYDSRWDVMSDIWGNCPPYDATYGCVGVHTISYHKDYLGWIPSSRKYVPAKGSTQTIRLERLAIPASSSNYLIVQIPIGTSGTRFYTFEARFFMGYDQTLPGEAIIIHLVDTTVDRPAQVVDVDGNGDPDDAGAMWTVGETFVDEANGISFSVVSKSSSSFEVTVTDSTPVLSVTPQSQDFGSVTLGNSADRTFTVQNTGVGTLTGNATTSAPFSMASGGSFSLGAGQSQTVAVRFTPTAAGAVSRTVDFSSNVGTLSRNVTGTGVTAPVLSVTPDSQDFGNVTVGSSADRTFTVQNTGWGTLTGNASTSAPFSTVSGGSFSLGAGQSQAGTVRFTPTAAGAVSRTVEFSSNGGTASRTVSGTGSSLSYTLTVTKSGDGVVTSSPAGINCGATCTATYSPGTTVQLSAKPSTGWQFKGWSGACSGKKACQVKMDSNKTVQANFTKKKKK